MRLIPRPAVARVAFVAVLVGVGVAVLWYANSTFGSGKGNPASTHFTIVETDFGPSEGLNGSAYRGSQTWPVITVRQGQTVTIHIVNVNSSEVHGFAIAHYFEAGVSLRPGNSFDVTFVANQVGTFRIFCNVFCAIHPFMQNGALDVVS